MQRRPLCRATGAAGTHAAAIRASHRADHPTATTVRHRWRTVAHTTGPAAGCPLGLQFLRLNTFCSEIDRAPPFRCLRSVRCARCAAARAHGHTSSDSLLLLDRSTWRIFVGSRPVPSHTQLAAPPRDGHHERRPRPLRRVSPLAARLRPAPRRRARRRREARAQQVRQGLQLQRAVLCCAASTERSAPHAREGCATQRGRAPVGQRRLVPCRRAARLPPCARRTDARRPPPRGSARASQQCAANLLARGRRANDHRRRGRRGVHTGGARPTGDARRGRGRGARGLRHLRR